MSLATPPDSHNAQSQMQPNHRATELQIQLSLRELLDVDVLEGDDTH
jgi:hypothetical protein